MNRRNFVTGAAATLFALRSARLLAATTPTKRLVYGTQTGAVSTQLATGALNILNTQAHTNYISEVQNARNTLQATETVKAAAPDGNTLLQIHSSAMTLYPNTYRNLTYNPSADFIPLAIMGQYAFSLILGPAVPAGITTVDGYLGWVDKNPDYRDIGFAINGSQANLLTLMLARKKEVALRPQSYTGAASMLGDLQKQTLGACITLSGNASGLMGGSRAVAVSHDVRLESLPNVATFSEQGLSSLTMQGWFGWFAPAGLPAATVQALADEIAVAQRTPEYIALVKQLMLTMIQEKPAQIRTRIDNELAEYKQLVQSYGLTQMASAGSMAHAGAIELV